MPMTVLGNIVRTRRESMEMSLNGLTQRLGGSPGPGFLSKIESGKITPTRDVALRLASALQLSDELMLNAAGHASAPQQAAALEKLREVLVSGAPVMIQVPVYTADGPTGQRRPRLLRQREDVRIVDLADPGSSPFTGEVLYAPERKPLEGYGVVMLIDGELSAWTYHIQPRSKGFIENGRQERRGFDESAFQGVILRVMTEMDLEK